MLLPLPLDYIDWGPKRAPGSHADPGSSQDLPLMTQSQEGSFRMQESPEVRLILGPPPQTKVIIYLGGDLGLFGQRY